MSNQLFHDTIKDFLQSGSIGGRTTEEIEDHYKLSSKQVGGLMSSLSRKGLVQTYTKGHIVVNNEYSGIGAPMGISKSFYEWINK